MSLTPSAYANFLSRLHIFSGAGGGGRTHTVSLPRDFESRASANSTTPANCLNSIQYHSSKIKRFIKHFEFCIAIKFPHGQPRAERQQCRSARGFKYISLRIRYISQCYLKDSKISLSATSAINSLLVGRSLPM